MSQKHSLYNSVPIGLHELAVIVDKVLLILSVILGLLLLRDILIGPEFVFLTELLYLVLWVVFVVEFSIHLITTKNKIGYIRKEFLVIFIILFPFLRPLRLFPASRWALVILAEQVNDRFPIVRRLKVLEILLTSIVLVILSADLFMLFEKGENSKFQTFADAIWFSVVTVATVGYGDIYPQTTPGRILATLLIIFGVSVFGLITASISSYFVEKNIESGRRKEKSEHNILVTEEGNIESALVIIYKKLEAIQKKLDKLEKID